MATWQLSKRTIISVRVVTIVGLFAVLLYLLPNWLIRIPSVQSWLGNQVSTTISQALNSPTSIERISLNGWSELEVEKLKIYDPSGLPALSLKQLRASISLWSFLSGERIDVHALRLFEPDIRLSTDSSGRLNVQPILDALATSDTISTTYLGVHSILIRDGRVRYAERDSTILTLEELNLKVNRLSIEGDSIGGQLERLSLCMPNGFVLKQLSGYASLKGANLSLTDIVCMLPNSEVRLPRLTLATDKPGITILQSLELGRIELAIQDLSPLYPPLSSLGNQVLRIKGDIVPSEQRINLGELSIQLGDLVEVQTYGSLNLTSNGGIEQVVLQAQQIGISSAWSAWLPRLLPHLLPEATIHQLAPIGGVNYRGRLSLKPNEQVSVEGTLRSALGACVIRGQVNLEAGRVATTQVRLSTTGLMLAPLDLGILDQIGGAIDADLSWLADDDVPIGNVALQLDQLRLKGQSDLKLRADVHRNSSNAPIYFTLNSAQTPAVIEANGKLSLEQEQIRDLELNIERASINLDRLWGQASVEHIALEGLRLHASELTPRASSAKLIIPKLELRTNQGVIDLGGSRLSIQQQRQSPSSVTLHTPWLHAELTGGYRLEHLPSALWAKLKADLPILHQSASSSKGERVTDTNASLSLKIDSIPSIITSSLGLPINIVSPTSLMAHFDTQANELRFRLNSEHIYLGGHNFSAIHLDYSQGGELELASDVHLSGGGKLIGAQLRVQSQGNHLSLYSDFGLDEEGTENGILHLQCDLLSRKPIPDSWRDVEASVRIAPSRLRLHTAYWDIAPAHIKVGQGLVSVEGLKLSTPERSLQVEGAVALDEPSQELLIDLKQINLRYILEAVGVDFDMIDTDLTGKIRAYLDGDILRAKADVTSPALVVQGHEVGAIGVALSFNSQDMLIVLDGKVTQPHGGYSLVEGYIRPTGEAGIDLEFDASRLEVSFVGRFLDGIFNTLSGYGTGRMRLHGLFERGVTVEGEANIAQGMIGVRTLGTRYFFDHHLVLEEDRVIFDDVKVRDDEGNQGRINGYIGHRYFDSFDINLKADQMQRLKVLQTTSPKDMPVYGKAYASGQATLRGHNDRIGINVDLKSEAGTDVVLDFNPTTASKDEQLIRFSRLRSLDSIAVAQPDSNRNIAPTSAIDLDLRFTITPEARLGMNLTADLSNELRGHAEGVLTIKAPSQGEPQVYGSLTALDGTFSVRIQQLAHKRFMLRPNGQIAFRGDPMQATMNLQAIYSLTANISDLDENLSAIAGRTNVPVHCILGLMGSIMRPDIRFGLELPGADSDLERRVRSLLNTNDAVTRQMLSLITLGKFYTDATVARTSKSTNDLTAAVSSTISEQLSYLLGNFSRNFQFGTNIKTSNTSFDDTDIELLFSGSLLNDRLTINGNVGYHDNPYLERAYMGEFDLEYKINRSGSFRLKGYNRYNNMYQYLRQSRMTQGLGVLFRQRFDRLSDFWRITRRPTTSSTIMRADTTILKPSTP